MTEEHVLTPDDDERGPQAFSILGRKIGTTTGWDDGDVGEFIVYGFNPLAQFAPLFKQDWDTVFVDFNEGVLKQHDSDGHERHCVDMIDMLRDVPRDDANGEALKRDVWPVHDEVDLTTDPILDAIEGAGLTVAFDIPAGASWNEAVQAMVGNTPSDVVKPITREDFAGPVVTANNPDPDPDNWVKRSFVDPATGAVTPAWPSEVRKVDDASMFGSDDAGKGGWGNRGDG